MPCGVCQEARETARVVAEKVDDIVKEMGEELQKVAEEQQKAAEE